MRVSPAGCIPNSLAKFHSAEIRHQPIRDHERRMVLREEINCFLAGLGKQHGIVLGRKRLLNQFARDW